MKEVPFSGPDADKATKEFVEKRGKGSGKLGMVRTYRADVQELITKKKVTRTHVAMAEEERRRAIGESSVWEEQKATSLLPLFIAAAFLLIGVSILLYDLTGKSISIFEDTGPKQVFVIPDGQTQVVKLSKFTRDELTVKLRMLVREKKLPQGAHLRVGYRASSGTSTLMLPLQSFFLTLEGAVPDTLTRSLGGAYEGGIISAGETKGYLLFTTTYYENSVVGLLSWEKRMFKDLYPVIDPLRAELLPTATEGTWKAQTWDGNDLRVFTTTDERVALVYGWVSKEHLIITGSIQSFTELARGIRGETPER
jgi:hypothetical protein